MEVEWALEREGRSARSLGVVREDGRGRVLEEGWWDWDRPALMGVDYDYERMREEF